MHMRRRPWQWDSPLRVSPHWAPHSSWVFCVLPAIKPNTTTKTPSTATAAASRNLFVNYLMLRLNFPAQHQLTEWSRSPGRKGARGDAAAGAASEMSPHFSMSLNFCFALCVWLARTGAGVAGLGADMSWETYTDHYFIMYLFCKYFSKAQKQHYEMSPEILFKMLYLKTNSSWALNFVQC